MGTSAREARADGNRVGPKRLRTHPARNALAGLNDTVQAMKQMEEAVALDPTSAPAQAALGSVQFWPATGRRASFERRSRCSAVGRIISRSRTMTGRPEIAPAEEDLKAALRRWIRRPPPSTALALLYLTDKRPQEASRISRACRAVTRRRSRWLTITTASDATTRRCDPQPLARDRSGRVARMRMAATLRQQGRHRTRSQ
jgi:hypothetical protein